MPYWVVNTTSLPLTLQHYFHPSMLSGGGTGIYDTSDNPLFSGDGNGGGAGGGGGVGGGDGDPPASEERAQHLRLAPAVSGGARGYAAAAAVTAVAAASTAAAGLAAAKTSPAATAVVGVLPPAPVKQPLGLGLKLLVEEEGERLNEEEGRPRSGNQREEEQAAGGLELPRSARGGDDEHLLL